MTKILQHVLEKIARSSVYLTPYRTVTYRQKMPPPDRWLDYSNCGKVIPGTNILCFKVPLKNGLLRTVPAEQWFTPKQLIDDVEKEHRKLKLVIDLTFTRKYYFTDEFTRNGVDYLKIFTEGHVIPSDDVVHRFFDAVETTKAESDDAAVIGVHCTHGVNRTGYMVCRYMIERLAFKPEEAIQAFNAARGHDLERENYLADLHTKTFLEGYKNEERHKLEQKKPQSTNHSHQHSERQRPHRRSGSQGKDFHNNDNHGNDADYHYNRRSGSHDKDTYYWRDRNSSSHGNDDHKHYGQHSGSHGNHAHRQYDRRSGSRDKDTYNWHSQQSNSHSKSYHTDAYHDNTRYGSAYEDRYPYGEYTFEIEEGKRDTQNEWDGWDSRDHRGQRHDYRGHSHGFRHQGYNYKGQGQDSRGQQYIRPSDGNWRMSHHEGWQHSNSGYQTYHSQNFRDHEGSGRRQSYERSDRHQGDKYSHSYRSRDGQDVKRNKSQHHSRTEHSTQQQSGHS